MTVNLWRTQITERALRRSSQFKFNHLTNTWYTHTSIATITYDYAFLSLLGWRVTFRGLSQIDKKSNPSILSQCNCIGLSFTDVHHISLHCTHSIIVYIACKIYILKGPLLTKKQKSITCKNPNFNAALSPTATYKLILNTRQKMMKININSYVLFDGRKYQNKII